MVSNTLAVLSVVFTLATLGVGQGLPEFHTVLNLGPEAVDVANLNVVLNAPIHDKASGEFSFGININSAPVAVQPSFREAHTGSTGFQTFPGTCPNGTATTKEMFWTYTDANGTVHKFPTLNGPFIDTKHCLTQVLSGVTTDQSGYTLIINPTTYVATVYDEYGGAHNGTTFTDANGNTVSSTNNVWSDVLAQTVLSQTGSTNTSVTYAYTDAAGASRQVVVSDGFKTWQTACSTNTNSLNAITNISYPDGTSMQFTYEPTSLGSTHITGRFASITLRTGGVINYTYSGGTSGVNCSNSTTTILKRITTDGTWTFDTTKIAGSTVVTDASGNDTVYKFVNGAEIYRQVYQGSYTTGTLLLTKGTCYNGAAPNCSAQTSIPATITSIDLYTYIPGVANPSRIQQTYDTNGNLTNEWRYDFGGSSPISKQTISYGSDNQGTCVAIGNNIIGKPCLNITTDNAGNIKAKVGYSYDSRGNLLSTSRLVSGSTYLTSSATYNTNGTVATSTDVNGFVTTLAYNGGCNNFLPTLVTRTQKVFTTTTWDCNGGVAASVTDGGNNHTSTMTYLSGTTADPFYRVLSITDQLGNTTNYTYHPNSTETIMTFSSSVAESLTTIDGYGRVISAQRQQAPNSLSFDTVSRAYDANGRLATLSMPCTSTTRGGTCSTVAESFSYDGLGRVINISNPGTGGYVSKTYTNRDVLLTRGPQVSGENLKQRQVEYDGLGRLTSVCEITSASGSGACGQSVAATGYKTSYSYDVLSNLTVVTQGAQTRTFAYDALSRPTSAQHPETGLTTYIFDVPESVCGSNSSPGDLVEKKDAAGNVTCIAYDTLHRKTRVTFPSGPNSGATPSRNFVYDTTTFACPNGSNVAGRLAEAYTGDTKITDFGYCYSPRGELTDLFESTPHSGGFYHTIAVYAANGIPISLSGVPSVGTFTYGLEGEGRWSTSALTGTGAMNFVYGTTYNSAAQPVTIDVASGSGDNDTYTYDSNTGQIKTFAFTVGATPATFQGTLGWNANGTLQSLTISDGFKPGGAQACSYSYDDLERLAGNNCGSVFAQTFGYDQYGNITKSGSASWMPGYNSSNNRYTLAGTSYDADGQLLTDTFHAYTWDAVGKIATIDSTACGTSGTCVTYDAFGRMVEKNKSGTISEVLYTPLGEFGFMSGQTIVTGRIPLAGGGTLLLCCGNRVYQHKDWLASVRFGHSMWSRSLYTDTSLAPFGETYNDQLNGSVDPNFTGHSQDIVTGEYDTPNRQLSPTQGRWLSPDPAGLAAVNPANPQSWNLYAYIENNPLNGVDPLGLCEETRGFTGCHHLPHLPQGGGGDDDFGTATVNLDCTCGNDIFDAIAGAPGTYLFYDQRGNLSWGFSIEQWQKTMAVIDAIYRYGDRFDWATNTLWRPHVDTNGWGKTVINYGTMTVEDWTVARMENAYSALAEQIMHDVEFHVDPNWDDSIERAFDIWKNLVYWTPDPLPPLPPLPDIPMPPASPPDLPPPPVTIPPPPQVTHIFFVKPLQEGRGRNVLLGDKVC